MATVVLSESVEIFNNLLQLAVENGASDIHVKTNKPAFLRLHGRLEPVDMDPLTRECVIEFVETACPKQFLEKWHERNQIDFSYEMEGLGRFRVNAFHQRGSVSIVFRHVKDKPPTLEQLNHDPEALLKMCQFYDGIVLVCGPTGCGKSSTLAAMLNWINHNMDKHIVTLEDPIEYTYTDVQCVINQREIGIDAPSFLDGMIAVLRQDPDIILVGEMRDRPTFDTALSAAETGHLVFGTLHSANAQQAVQRLFEFYPPEQQGNMRRQIASTLRATVTQKLVPALEGSGRIPVVEIFMVEALARRVIEEGNYEKIPQVIEADKDSGSKSFNQDLHRLIKAGFITKKDGLHHSPNPKALEMNLKGIFLSSGSIVN